MAGQLGGWVPIRFYFRRQRAMVDWCLLEDIRFTEPFFEETIRRAMQRPFHVLFRHQTPAEMLEELEREEPAPSPACFLFHTSRCGSTLLSRMLAALPETVMISEAPPIDSVLRAHRMNPSVTDQQREQWLRGMIGALGRQSGVAVRRYLVKFDCWHTLDLELIRRAFPATPWVFLYRDPLELLASLMAQPALWTLGGVIEGPSSPQLSREEYCGRVMAAIFEHALAGYKKGGGVLVSYPELPGAVWDPSGGLPGTSFTTEEIELMKTAAEREAYSSDSETGGLPASEIVRRICGESLYPLYSQLEELRKRAIRL